MAEKINLKGMRVLVIGLARTGVATALFCAERGAVVTATDSRSAAELGESVEKLTSAGVRLKFDDPASQLLQGQQLIVPSPGVPADDSILIRARELKIPVWSEIGLAYRFLLGTLIVVTGSNGQTTATSLIEHTLRHAGISTLLAGNLLTPLFVLVTDPA